MPKIDLHVHAQERSHCAHAGEESVIQAAIDYGLDGLVFTDHHRFVPPERLDELNRIYQPFGVFGGIEISLVEKEDVLVYGVRDPALEERGWDYVRLYDFVRQRGGFLIHAHPFRYRDPIGFPINRFPPDGIECHSLHVGLENSERVTEIAERLGLLQVCTSDAHRAEHVGIYYAEMERMPRDEDDLVEMLRAGACECGSMPERIAAINRGRAILNKPPV